MCRKSLQQETSAASTREAEVIFEAINSKSGSPDVHFPWSRLSVFQERGFHMKEAGRVGGAAETVPIFLCSSWIVLARRSALSPGHNTKQACEPFSPLTAAWTLKTGFGVSAMNWGP